MKYDFDKLINRYNTDSTKWDNVGERVGNADALPMWVADTDFQCPQPIINAIIKRAEHGIYGYTFVNKDFAEVTQEWIKKHHDWSINADWVAFSPGVVPTINTMVQAVTLPGDEVIIQRPVYYPFIDAIRNNGRIVSSNSLVLSNGHYEIDFDDLRKRAERPRAKLLILCNPHNPVGRVFNEAELELIGEICIENKVLILSDEIHSDIIYSGNKHIPIASLSSNIANNTVTTMAPSKTFNTAGLRTSSCIIPNINLRSLLGQIFLRNRTSIINIFGLTAYIAAYRYCEDYLEHMLDYIEKNLVYLNGFIQTNMPKIKVVYPEGTYLTWIDCRGLNLDNDELDNFIIKKSRVAVDSGHWFGEEGNGFIRLNIACPRSTLIDGLNRIFRQYECLKVYN